MLEPWAVPSASPSASGSSSLLLQLGGGLDILTFVVVDVLWGFFGGWGVAFVNCHMFGRHDRKAGWGLLHQAGRGCLLWSQFLHSSPTVAASETADA